GQAACRRSAGHRWIPCPTKESGEGIGYIARQGLHGLETFGNVIESWEAKGGLRPILAENKLQLISGYCTANLTDTSKRNEEREKMIAWGRLIQKYGGKISVIGPNNVNRNNYDFNANKSNIVAALNDYAKALTDL